MSIFQNIRKYDHISASYIVIENFYESVFMRVNMNRVKHEFNLNVFKSTGLC